MSPEEVVALFGPPETEIIAAKVGPMVYEKALAEYYALYGDKTAALGAYPGIKELLRDLAAAGCRLGVVTGKGRPTTDQTLRRTGTADFFQVVVSGHDVARPKPDPEGIRRALTLLGAGAEETVYVGDMGSDALAAKGAGVAFAGAAWDRRRWENLAVAGAGLVFTSPAKLGAWLLRDKAFEG